MSATVSKISPGSKEFYLKQPHNYSLGIESVLAFHESELGLSSNQTSQSTLVKDLSYEVREHPPFTSISPTSKVYRSWGVVGADGKPQPYKLEPLQILGKKLKEALPNLSFKVLDSIPPTEKDTDLYNSWIIRKASSVAGAGEQRICDELPRAKKSPKSWDSFGIQVASPAITAVENEFQIRNVIDHMAGHENDQYGCFTTNQCGFSVQVGCSKFEVIQKLALICLVYEEEISHLHPPCRRHDESDSNDLFQSNRLRLLASVKHVPTMYKDCSTSAIIQRGITIKHLEELMSSKCQTTIDNNTLKYQADKADLARFMNYPAGKNQYTTGNPNRAVNFTTCVRTKDQQCTVEFRQHRGTLSIEDIENWVEFVVNLVRLAEYYAEYPENFPVQKWEDTTGSAPAKGKRKRVRVFDLIDEMELPNAKRIYWEGRVAKYMCSEKGGPDDRSDDELDIRRLQTPESSKLSDPHSSPRPIRTFRSPGSVKGQSPSEKSKEGNTIDAGVWATEHFTHDGFTWKVTNFNMDEWNTEYTDTRLGRSTMMCGINALVQSFQAQYPESPYANPKRKDEYVNLAKTIQPTISRKEGVTDDTLERLISILTKDEYRLVRVDFSGARRWDQEGGPGKSLYIYISGHDPFQIQKEKAAKQEAKGKGKGKETRIENPNPMGHWESMRRKDGIKEHA
ncbi:hypothetical protein B7463_g10493, partial [Scytalidium lignicola]